MIDVTEQDFEQQVIERSQDDPRRRRLLGRVVRPVPRAGPDPREGRRRPRGQGRPRQARHRRQPADRAGSTGIQGSRPSRPSRTAAVVDEFVGAHAAAQGRALLRRAACPARPTRWSRPATRRRCAARSSSSPRAPTPRLAPRDPASASAATATRRWRCSPTRSGDFAADGLAARIRLERDGDEGRGRRPSRRSTTATREGAVDLLIEAIASADGDKDDLRRVVVGDPRRARRRPPARARRPPPAGRRAVLAGRRGQRVRADQLGGCARAAPTRTCARRPRASRAARPGSAPRSARRWRPGSMLSSSPWIDERRRRQRRQARAGVVAGDRLHLQHDHRHRRGQRLGHRAERRSVGPVLALRTRPRR